MNIDRPFIPCPKSKKNKKVEISNFKWTIFSICLISIFIVVSLTKTILPLLFFGLVLAFIWSQATKPVAKFESERKPSGKQLNLFNQKQRDQKFSNDRINNDKERRAA